MRFVSASPHEVMEWGIQELELRQADKELRDAADCEKRKQLRAKAIGATIHQANMACGDALMFLKRKGIRT